MTVSKLSLIPILLSIFTVGGCKERDSSKQEPQAYTGPEIHQMVIQGNSEAVRTMTLQNPALIHIQDKYDNTHLHLASYHGRTEIVTLLLKRGADVNARNDFGATALRLASYAGRKDVVLSLIEHGANVNTAVHAGNLQVCLFVALRRTLGLQQARRRLIRVPVDHVIAVIRRCQPVKRFTPAVCRARPVVNSIGTVLRMRTIAVIDPVNTNIVTHTVLINVARLRQLQFLAAVTEVYNTPLVLRAYKAPFRAQRSNLNQIINNQ